MTPKKLMNKQLRKKIQDFRDKFGRYEAEIRLVEYGLSHSLAQKILADCYPSIPKGLYLKAILFAIGEQK